MKKIYEVTYQKQYELGFLKARASGGELLPSRQSGDERFWYFLICSVCLDLYI